MTAPAHAYYLASKNQELALGIRLLCFVPLASAGTYAVNLAAKLRERGYDVFLDRAEYAMGDDWKKVGETALRNTQRLVLIATHEAVFESKPVEREVVLFSQRKRQIIPIFFGDTFSSKEQDNPGKSQVLELLPDATLYIEDKEGSLTGQMPTDAVVDKLVSSHGVMKRRALRQAIAGWTIAALVTLGIISTIAAITANRAKIKETEAKADVELKLAETYLENGKKILASNGDVSSAVMWFSKTFETKGLPAEGTRSSARRIISSLSLQLPSYSLVHPEAVSNFSLDASEKILATSSGNDVYLWNLDSVQLIAGPLHHPNAVTDVELSADGKRLVTSWYSEEEDVFAGEALLWNLTMSPPTKVSLDVQKDSVYDVAFSRDGKYAAAASFNGGCLFESETGSLVHGPIEGEFETTDILFSPDNKFLVSLSYDSKGIGGVVALYDIENSKTNLIEWPEAAPKIARFTSEGSYLLVAKNDGQISVYAPDQLGEPSKTFETNEEITSLPIHAIQNSLLEPHPGRFCYSTLITRRPLTAIFHLRKHCKNLL